MTRGQLDDPDGPGMQRHHGPEVARLPRQVLEADPGGAQLVGNEAVRDQARSDGVVARPAVPLASPLP